ncbi:MAG TPA: lipid-A-disaccharide synthase N-terminal domain-containing protein [Bacteroidota bacterium]
MTLIELIGYIGLAGVVICWIPQSIETIRAGRCTVNLTFLILMVVGSVCLTIYAIAKNDLVFSILNSLTTVGALINLYYKLFPRSGARSR